MMLKWWVPNQASTTTRRGQTNSKAPILIRKGSKQPPWQRLLPLVVGNAIIVVRRTIMRTSAQGLSLVATAKFPVMLYLHAPSFRARRRESLTLPKPLATHLVAKVFLILFWMELFYFVIILFEFFLIRVRPILLYQKNLLILFLWMFCV